MHLNSKLTGTIICIAFILQSCIYEFIPKTGNYENFLVIYGMVTTENGPHEITILKTSYNMITMVPILLVAPMSHYQMIKEIQYL